MALGLISSEQLAAQAQPNVRRKIFHAFPNGTAPLTGLLSMMENEETTAPEFGWNEERWTTLKTVAVAGPGVTGNKTGPFATAGGTTASGNSDGIFSLAQFGAIRIYVADAGNFQVDDTVRLFNVGTAASGTTATAYDDLSGRVTGTGPGWVEIQATVACSNILNSATYAVGKYLLHTGSAFAEGSGSRSGRRVIPCEIKNYTQIFKTAFELTRTAMKQPLQYDASGEYKNISKTNGINHLASIEWSMFFGEKAKTTATDDEGNVVSRRFMGGLLWFLKQYELGTAYGLSDISASAWRSEPGKRIIRLQNGTITKSEFNDLNTRVFERTNAADWSKLCLCGPGYLGKVAEMFQNQIQVTSLREQGYKGLDFELTQHSSNAGKVFYKQHPLFTDPVMRNSAFYIDMGYLGYRPLKDSDTDIQPMIQAPDADKRKDQWLTECGLEIRFPEAFMYVENLGGITTA